MNSAYVTYIVNTIDLKNAEILKKTISFSTSQFHLFVLLPTSADEKLRTEVTSKFFNVFEVTVPKIFSNLCMKVFFKLFCWTLDFFASVLFLEPSAMVIKNCDRLLRKEENVTLNVQGTNMNSSVLLLLPKRRNFLILMNDTLSFQKGGYDFETAFLKSVIKNFSPKSTILLSEVSLKNIGYAIWDAPIIMVSSDKEMHAADKDQITNGGLRFLATFTAEIKRFKVEKYDSPSGSEPVAVIGVSCRFPMSNNIHEFWNILKNGIDCIQTVPNTRWTKNQSCNEQTRAEALQAGFLQDNIEDFDGKFFGTNHLELLYTDPQHRLLMQLAWEALEDARIPSSKLNGTSTAIYVGVWTHDYKDLLTESGFRNNEFFRTYMGNSAAACSSRLARLFKTTGETLTIESGCSSSMVAIGHAMSALRSGKCDVALACGVNLLLKPFCYQQMHMICSKDARCKSFDERANGYARSEGASVFILKRLSDAIADNDKIYGLLTGYGEIQDSLSACMGLPSVEGEILAMKMALRDANVDPNCINYVEAHGTGTLVGDLVELEALQNVYCEGRNSKLLVGSLKSNIGHTESCSGLASILKVLLSFKYELIPKNLHFNNLNQNEKFESDLIIVSSDIEFKTSQKKRIVGVNNFGIAGTNTHLIIEEFKKTKTFANSKGILELPNYVIVISAKSEPALSGLIKRYCCFLSQKHVDVKDLAFSSSLCRNHFPKRIAVLGKTAPDILNNLKTSDYFTQRYCKKSQKICFVFPDEPFRFFQAGMVFYNNIPSFRKSVHECAVYLQSTFEISILRILEEEYIHEGSQANYYECATLVLQYAFCNFIKKCGIEPACVLGYGIGEYAAACCANVMTIKNALYALVKKSDLFETSWKAKMITVGSSIENVQDMLNSAKQKFQCLQIQVVAEHSLNNVVLSGTIKSVNQFEKLCDESGIRTETVRSLPSVHPFVKETIICEFKKVLDQFTFNSATCMYVSSTTGDFVSSDAINAQYWIDNLQKQIEFRQCCTKLGPEEFIYVEIGAQSALCKIMVENFGEQIPYYPSFGHSTEQQWNTMLKTIAQLYLHGADINWNVLYGHIEHKKIVLPSHPFTLKPCWFPSRMD